jgi:hypothetical protein
MTMMNSHSAPISSRGDDFIFKPIQVCCFEATKFSACFAMDFGGCSASGTQLFFWKSLSLQPILASAQETTVNGTHPFFVSAKRFLRTRRK